MEETDKKDLTADKEKTASKTSLIKDDNKENERVDTKGSNKSSNKKLKEGSERKEGERTKSKKLSKKVTITKVDYPLKQRKDNRKSTISENDKILVEKTLVKSELEPVTNLGTSRDIPHIIPNELHLINESEENHNNDHLNTIEENEKEKKEIEDAKNAELKKEIELKEYII